MIKDKQERRIALEKDIENYSKREENNYKDIIKLFSKNAFKYFALPLFPKALEILDSDTSYNKNAVPDMDKNAIEHILKRGVCLCGCDINANSDAKAKIEHEKNLLNSNSGNLMRNFRDKIDTFSHDVSDFATSIESKYNTMVADKENTSEKEAEKKKIERELKNTVDINSIERERNELKKKVDRLNERLNNLEYVIGEKDGDIKRLEKDLESIIVTSDKNERIQKAIAYAEAIYNWFSEAYTKNITEIKTDLQNSINKIFSDMYHGKRIVDIDDKYQITLKVEGVSGAYETDTSMGLESVKNFAFVTGLTELARKKANDKKPAKQLERQAAEPYPLVIDAAFSNTDETHIKNISKVLPKVAEQVILIIMEKDWDCAKSVLNKKLGKSYRIEKHSEVNSSLVGDANV